MHSVLPPLLPPERRFPPLAAFGLGRWAALFGGILLLAGCGGSSSGDKATVSGKVTVKGSPATGATITFIGENNKRDNSGVGADGSYRMNNAPVGAVKVTVTPGSATPSAMAGGQSSPPPATIPPKYAQPDNGLSYTVTKGAQTKDFDLTP